MSADSSGKFDLLVQMAVLQSKDANLMLEAELAKKRGDLTAAAARYDEFVHGSRTWLDLASVHNRQHDDPIEIGPVVQTLVNVLFMQADLLDALGDGDRGNVLRSDALEFSSQYLGQTGQVEAERSRAAALIASGRFNEALTALAFCRDFYQRNGNHVQLARVTIDIADILQWLGDYSRAQEEIKRANDFASPMLSGRGRTKDNLAAALRDMITSGSGQRAEQSMAVHRISTEIDYFQGLIYKGLRRFDEAEAAFLKVLPAYEELGVGAAIEFQLASVRLSRGDFSEVLTEVERLIPVFIADQRLRPKLAALRNIQAQALLGLERPEGSLSEIDRGILELGDFHDPDLLWRLQWQRGRILERLGRDEDAMAAYRYAMATVNELRRAPLGYRLDSTYMADKLPLFRSAIILASRHGDADQALTFMELMKARGLAIALSTRRSTKGESDPLGGQFDELTRQLDGIEYEAYRDGWTETLRSRRDRLFAERMELLERIRFSDPRWRSMTEPIPFDPKSIRDRLAARGQAAIDLFLDDDGVTAVLVADGRSQVVSMPVPASVRSSLEEYQLNLQAEEPDLEAFDLSGAWSVQATDILPQKLLTQALASRSLLISPHGMLHFVPWALLVHEGRRLCEYLPVGVLPNLSIIERLDAEFSKTPSVALIGAPDYPGLRMVRPLQGAAEELAKLSTLYDAKRMVGSLVGSQATEAGFWQLARDAKGSAGILHIACHGTFEVGEPMHSGLLLTDSVVDAAEIARSQLPYDEAILSACSTGWRPLEVQDVVLSGDDVLGLPGAFLEAGVRSILVSIPPAPDEATREFMLRYHRHRSAGVSPLGAYRDTQMEMLANALYPPYSWAGLVMYGCR